MSNAGTNDWAAAQYVIEIDGNKHSERAYFVEAIKEGLLLRGNHPHAKIKVRDLSQTSSAEMNSDIAA